MIQAKEEESVDSTELFSKHGVFDYVAHKIAYAEYGGLSKRDQLILWNAGYGFEEKKDLFIVKGVLGFQLVLIRSKEEGKNDLIAIRGTNPGASIEDLQTIYSDLDPKAVGRKQYLNNREWIGDMIEFTGGKFDLVGHSLGGAMAQHVAADPDFASSVNQLVTFQSPGIDQESVDRFKSMPEDERATATHHIVKGDIVDRAGDANLPGTVYEHDIGLETNVDLLLQQSKKVLAYIALLYKTGYMLPIATVIAAKLVHEIKVLVGYLNDIVTAHTAFVFSFKNYEEEQKAAGISKDKAGYNSDNDLMTRSSNVTKHDSYPHGRERAKTEAIRDVLGPKLEKIMELYFWLVRSLKDKLSSSKGIMETYWDNMTNTVKENFLNPFLSALMAFDRWTQGSGDFSGWVKGGITLVSDFATDTDAAAIKSASGEYTNSDLIAAVASGAAAGPKGFNAGVQENVLSAMGSASGLVQEIVKPSDPADQDTNKALNTEENKKSEIKKSTGNTTKANVSSLHPNVKKETNSSTSSYAVPENTGPIPWQTDQYFMGEATVFEVMYTDDTIRHFVNFHKGKGRQEISKDLFETSLYVGFIEEKALMFD